MLALMSFGALMLVMGYLFGFVPLILGGLMLQGLKWPPDAKTKKVWIITAFGQMTDVKVTGLTMLLDWLPMEIIGKVEIDMVKVDHDFKLTKPVRCIDGIYIDNTVSEISVSMSPDDKDDVHGLIAYPKTGGEKLRDFQNAGGIEGVKRQLDDILTSWIQEIAKEPGHDSKWMEENGLQIAEILLPRIKGEVGATRATNNPDLDDVRGLGIAFNKFQVVLLPSQKIIDARNDVQVQNDKRAANRVNTETVNLQIVERLQLYRNGKRDGAGNVLIPPTPTDKIPSIETIRGMIIQEMLAHDGKLTQTINQGGLTVFNNTPSITP
jgi:hypothetical protein